MKKHDIAIAPYRDAVAADGVARSGRPYIWFDVQDPRNPGWVLRYGDMLDEALAASDKDDEAAALAEADAFLTKEAAGAARRGARQAGTW